MRARFADAPALIHSLERDAERLRRRGNEPERLRTAVAALEGVRLGMLRLQAGVATADDLTVDLEQAQEIADQISAELAARREVGALLGQRPD
jgi:hypothetical protein